MAYGLLNLTPDRFGRLTPGEFGKLLDGYKMREELELEKAAWIVMHIANTCSWNLKQPLTVDKILGRESASTVKRPTQADLDWLKARMGK